MNTSQRSALAVEKAAGILNNIQLKMVSQPREEKAQGGILLMYINA